MIDGWIGHERWGRDDSNEHNTFSEVWDLGTSTGQGGRGAEQNPPMVSMFLEREVRVSDQDMNGESGNGRERTHLATWKACQAWLGWRPRACIGREELGLRGAQATNGQDLGTDGRWGWGRSLFRLLGCGIWVSLNPTAHMGRGDGSKLGAF